MKTEFMKRRFIISVLVLGMVGLGITFGGDVIVKEGSEYIANKLGIGTTRPIVALDVKDGEAIIAGSDAISGDATDVLVVTGGNGKDDYAAGKGSDISLAAGNGGNAPYTGTCGLGGDVNITAGIGGARYFSGETCADGGNITITGGAGGSNATQPVNGGNGGKITIASGNGGLTEEQAGGGDSGDIELTVGEPGSGYSGSNGDYGNILLAKNGGNVGIGTDSPSETLDVDGTVKMTGLIIPSGTTPAPDTEGALFLDTDAGINGTLKIYSNGAWRTVAEL